jgi:hypothetical protein
MDWHSGDRWQLTNNDICDCQRRWDKWMFEPMLAKSEEIYTSVNCRGKVGLT